MGWAQVCSRVFALGSRLKGQQLLEENSFHGGLQAHRKATASVRKYISSLHLFTHILLAKASHVAVPKVKGQRNICPAYLEAIGIMFAYVQRLEENIEK